jgi:hypothetical protein
MERITELVIPLFGIIFTIGLPLLLVFWIIYTKHRERMRLIEKGLTPEEVKQYFKRDEKVRASHPYGALKWGIIIFSLGVGIFVAHLLEDKFDVGDGISGGTILIFLGAGFLIYYLLVRSQSTSVSNNKSELPKN